MPCVLTFSMDPRKAVDFLVCSAIYIFRNEWQLPNSLLVELKTRSLKVVFEKDVKRVRGKMSFRGDFRVQSVLFCFI